MTTLYRVTFDIANNEDLRQVFELTDTNGDPIDLTGAVLRMDVERALGGKVLELRADNDRLQILDEKGGQFELSITAATLSVLTPGDYRHDLLLTLDGHIQRIWEGGLNLASGVTV